MRKLLFDGTEVTPWDSANKSLAAFIRGYNASVTLDPIGEDTPVSELPEAARTWIANRTLEGDPGADTVAGLIASPVVNPATNRLNRSALEAAGGELAEAYLAANEFKAPGPAPGSVKAIINSRTSGSFRRVKANGRDHIVTNMVPIVGDTVMNEILYPDEEVHKSFEQLNNLPAPSGHPQVEGRRVSAFHPMAVNAHNIGGFVRNPKKEGRRVVTEFWLDEQIALITEDGRETVRRIEAKEAVDVSTGLTLRLEQANGTGPDGKGYSAVGREYAFDHVAILLNETAAGAHVGTALVVNEAGEALVTATVDNVTAGELQDQLETAVARRIAALSPPGEARSTWVQEIELDEARVIFSVMDPGSDASRLFAMRYEQTDAGVSLLGDPQEVTRETRYVPTVGKEPEVQEGEDEMELTLEKVTEFLAGLGQVPVANEATAALETYEANREAFEAWRATVVEAVNAKRAKLVEFGDLSAEQVANLEEPMLDSLLAMSERVAADNRLRPGASGGTGEAGSGEEIITTEGVREIMSGAASKKEA